jgi:UDP-N-acetylmuramoyl-L-alanyl-D-glutamate--2,6-diaminopimelate ligase
MRLADIDSRYPSGLSLSGEGPGSRPVAGIAYDSRRVQPGEIFVALKGLRTDGHDHLAQAIAQGAAAVLIDATWAAEHATDLGVPVFHAADTREALAWLAAEHYGHPSRAMEVIGVTGTNGKTTTTHLIEAILQEAGRSTGLIGTLGGRYQEGGESQTLDTGHTTPQSLELQGLFARMKRSGVNSVVMEVSSHALDQLRVAHTDFDAAAFTNLTQDHLDYHQTMEAYAKAKAKLFGMIEPSSGFRGVAVNVDDAHGPTMAQNARVPVLTYSCLPAGPASRPADLRAEEITLTASGSRWKLVTPFGEQTLTLRLPGLFNISNALAALGCALNLGIPLATCVAGLERVRGVPGRVELVTRPEDPFSVLVDYAHTPDGLENVLKTAREFTRNRLLVVFGCGGDRDKGKRPQMGEIASRLADGVYLTSDNPRSEDPQAIMADVAAGIAGEYVAEADRADAITHAIDAAKAGDVIVIAGKGHETYQIFADRTIHFDDREVAREALSKRTGAKC